MSFKNLTRIEPEKALRVLWPALEVINKPFPRNVVFSPEENKEIENARQMILEEIQYAQEGNPKPLNLLCKWADEIAAYRKNEKEKTKLVGLLKGFDKPPPKFLLPPKNFLSFTLGLNSTGMEYALTILKAITAIEEWMDGGIPWERVKKCEVCDKFFLKKGRRKYCSGTCGDAKWQPSYDGREGYFKAIGMFEDLLLQGKSRKEAGEYLRKTQPYKKTIEDGNYNPEENWLKNWEV